MALRQSVKHFRPLAGRAPPLARSVVSSGTFSSKERAEEAKFFNKEDEKALRRLLAKMKEQTDVHDAKNAQAAEGEERAKLNKIVGKYNVSAADIEALLRWKHGE